MTILVVALAAVLAVTVATFARLLQQQQRAHQRREDLLVNQLLHASGNPWQPAPADSKPEQTQAPRLYRLQPEQHPAPPDLPAA